MNIKVVKERDVNEKDINPKDTKIMQEHVDGNRDNKLDKKNGITLGRIIRIGLPAGLQSVMYSASNVVVQASINSLGTDVVVAWTAYSKIDSVFWMMVAVPMRPDMYNIMFCYPLTWVVTSVSFTIYYLFFSRLRVVGKKRKEIQHA